MVATKGLRVMLDVVQFYSDVFPSWHVCVCTFILIMSLCVFSILLLHHLKFKVINVFLEPVYTDLGTRYTREK